MDSHREKSWKGQKKEYRRALEIPEKRKYRERAIIAWEWAGQLSGKKNLSALGKEAESFPSNAGGETAGVTERGPKLQHLGPSRQTSTKHPRELSALWPACSSLWKHKPLLWLPGHLPVKDATASGTASHTTAKCSHAFTWINQRHSWVCTWDTASLLADATQFLHAFFPLASVKPC